MGIDFGSVKKLPPEKRVEALKQVLDKLNEEIEERQEDVKTAQHMLTLAEDERRVLEEVEVPKARTAPAIRARPVREEAKTVEELAEKEELRQPLEKIQELEKLLATAPPRSDELIHRIAHMRSEDLYAMTKSIYERQQSTGIETEREREMIYAVKRGFEVKREEGYKAPDAKAEHLQTEGEKWAEKLYKSAATMYKN